MRGIYLFFVVMAVIATLLVLDQIWFNWVDPDVFFKLLLTEGVISGLVLAVYLFRKEFIEDKNMKKDKYTN